MRASRSGWRSARQTCVRPRSKLYPLLGSGLRCDWRGGEGHGSATNSQGFRISPDFWYTLETRLARITRPSLKCLVSGGHTATNRNASSIPDGMHIARHPPPSRRPSTPRIFRHSPGSRPARWTRVPDLYPTQPTRCSQARTTATCYRCRHARM